jgi:general stress protein 26
MSSEQPDAGRKHLYELVKDFKYAMLVTHSAGGGIHARPMEIAELRADADVYLVTNIHSPKIEEIERNPDVTLTFQSSGGFAAVNGRATVVRDQALIDRLWTEAWKLWFPTGKTDPAIAMIRFDAREGEYWDKAGAEGLKYMFEAVKAYVKGETPKNDEEQHGKVSL